MNALQVLLNADGESPTASTFKTLACILLQRHVEERVGRTEFQKLMEASTGTTDERWSTFTEEERTSFTNYLARATERWAERGSSFNKLLGFTQEGADNELVARVEFQMRKSGVAVLATSLTDLMHLDVSWSAALHLRNFAKSMHPSIIPPVEMTNRVMGLMTGYKTGLGGPRPWIHALSLYQETLASGYDTTLTTHTHALDALWRSADTFHRIQCTVGSAHRQFVWEKALSVCGEVSKTKLVVSGEEGCAYAEGVLKAVAAAGRWSTAVSLLANLDTTITQMSFRSLVPTAESYAFVIAACHATGHSAHGEALWTIFRGTYTPRSLHSEVLTILLQSFRNVVKISPVAGPLVEELVTDGKGLERTAVVACLQLVSSRYLVTKEPRWRLVSNLLRLYEANPWPQQPLARKAELQTVFRCCHLVAAVEGFNGKRVLTELRQRLVKVFGSSSAEVEWMDDAAIYALQTTTDLKEAIKTYDTVVGQRNPENVPYLPIPLRQAKVMLVEALLRCCKILQDGGELFLLDEDTQEVERDAAVSAMKESVLRAKQIYRCDDTFPHHLYAELLLIQVQNSGGKGLALEAMQHFSRGSADVINHRNISNLAQLLSLTELHIENALLMGHAALRYATFWQQEGAESPAYRSRSCSVDRAVW